MRCSTTELQRRCCVRSKLIIFCSALQAKFSKNRQFFSFSAQNRVKIGTPLDSVTLPLRRCEPPASSPFDLHPHCVITHPRTRIRNQPGWMCQRKVHTLYRFIPRHAKKATTGPCRRRRVRPSSSRKRCHLTHFLLASRPELCKFRYSQSIAMISAFPQYRKRPTTTRAGVGRSVRGMRSRGNRLFPCQIHKKRRIT